eukprot:4064337-Ditylum_brightwellii.AAC.2
MPSYLTENYNINLGDEGREVNNLEYDISLTPAKTKFHAHMRAINEIGFLIIDMEQNDLEQEYNLVRAAVGNSFEHTGQLKVMTYNKAMSIPECKKWDSSAIKEHDSFVKYEVWKPVPEEEVLEDAKVLTLT